MKTSRELVHRNSSARPGSSKVVALAAAAMLAAGSMALAGCSQGESSSSASGSTVATTIDDSAYDFEYSDRDLDSSYDEASATRITLDGSSATVESGDGATFADGVLTISKSGTYVLSGSLSDGQVVVQAGDDDKVQLVLSNASVACSTGPAIYVANADKCFVTLADGTSNSLSDGSSYSIGDDSDAGGAIYSTCDLTLNGSGSATITGSKKHGVFSKDDVRVTAGTWSVTAAADGVHGRDCVKVCGGDLQITAGDDGIASTNDEKAGKGYVGIDGGTLNITSTDKGIVAYAYMRVSAGTVSINAGDDGLHSDGSLHVTGGACTIDAGDDGAHCEYVLQIDDGSIDITESVEGLEGEKVIVNGGTQHVVASDDGVNAASHEDSSSTSTTSDSAGDAGNETAGEGSTPPEMPQESDNGTGADSTTPPEKPDGDSSSQDGNGGGNVGGQQPGGNAQDGQQPGGTGNADGSTPPEIPDGGGAQGNGDGTMQQPDGQGGNAGGGFGEYNEDCQIQINGGYLVVDASGDGLDSNGDISMTGGVALISGPTNDGNGSVDYAGSFSVEGGTLLAVGSSGMAQSPSSVASAYAQASVSGNAGQSVAITDESGNVLASFTAPKSFALVQFCIAGMQDGSTYQVVLDGTVAGANSDGYASSSTVSGGTSTSATASTSVSSGIAPGGQGGNQGDGQGTGGTPPQGGGDGFDGNAPSQGGQSQPQGQNTTTSTSANTVSL